MWEIKKYAGKLKEICSILTGIPVADFEKQEVKDRVLGEEWDKYKIYFSTGIPEFIYVNTLDDVQHFMDTHKLANVHSVPKVTLTVRQLLQQVGTDAMRNVIHPNVWVNALFADYISDRGYSYPIQVLGMSDEQRFKAKALSEPTEYDNGLPNWIITDTRFLNEAEAIKSRGGLLIRVNRDSATCLSCGQKGTVLSLNQLKDVRADGHCVIGDILPDSQKSTHPSETSLDSYEGFDEYVDNNGSIEELVEKVKVILIKYKII